MRGGTGQAGRTVRWLACRVEGARVARLGSTGSGDSCPSDVCALRGWVSLLLCAASRWERLGPSVNGVEGNGACELEPTGSLEAFYICFEGIFFVVKYEKRQICI